MMSHVGTFVIFRAVPAALHLKLALREAALRAVVPQPCFSGSGGVSIWPCKLHFATLAALGNLNMLLGCCELLRVHQAAHLQN